MLLGELDGPGLLIDEQDERGGLGVLLVDSSPVLISSYPEGREVAKSFLAVGNIAAGDVVDHPVEVLVTLWDTVIVHEEHRVQLFLVAVPVQLRAFHDLIENVVKAKIICCMYMVLYSCMECFNLRGGMTFEQEETVVWRLAPSRGRGGGSTGEGCMDEARPPT